MKNLNDEEILNYFGFDYVSQLKTKGVEVLNAFLLTEDDCLALEIEKNKNSLLLKTSNETKKRSFLFTKNNRSSFKVTFFITKKIEIGDDMTPQMLKFLYNYAI